MEKSKINLTWGEAIKWGVILVAVISSYAASKVENQIKNQEQDRRIEVLEAENAQYRELIAASAEQIAKVNGKMDIVLDYVETINNNVSDIWSSHIK